MMYHAENKRIVKRKGQNSWEQLYLVFLKLS